MSLEQNNSLMGSMLNQQHALAKLRAEIECYESPKQEKISHAFEHVVQNLKAYNRIKI